MNSTYSQDPFLGTHVVDADQLALHTDLCKQYLDSCTLGYHMLAVAGVEVDVAFDSLFDSEVAAAAVVVAAR